MSPRELALRVGAQERGELAALVAAALQADPAARVAARRRGASRAPVRLLAGRAGAADQRRDRSLCDRARRLALVVDYKSDGSGRMRTAASWSSATTRCSDCCTRSRCCAKARWRSRWCTGSWSARSGSRLATPLPIAWCSRSSWRQRIARARERRFAVSELPHRGLCLTCPGRAGLCSWPESETLRELSGDEHPIAPQAEGAESQSR